MSDAIETLAESLEEHGTGRANFHNATPAKRYNVARWLVIARSRVNASHAPADKTRGRYGTELSDVKNKYFHSCGEASISQKEASTMWWNVVYDGAVPAERYNLV